MEDGCGAAWFDRLTTSGMSLAPRRVPIRHGWVTPPCIWAFLSSLRQGVFFGILIEK